MSSTQRSRLLPSAAFAVALSGLLATGARADDGTLGSGSFRLIGASFDVTPVTQTVPIGVSAIVKTVFSGPVANLAQNGARVQAELTGPSVPGAVTLSTTPGGSFVLPALSIKGDYHLSSIRLTDGSGMSVPAAHASAVITVTDLLISSITSRALTSAELAARGIVVNDSNFKAYSFSLGLAIQGRTIVVDIPTIVKSKDSYVPIGPATVRVDNPDERFVPPTVMVVPMKSDDPPAGPDPSTEKLEDPGTSTPVFGIIIFPGNIRFLNQFFSVMLMVQNGSDPGSGLSLRDVTTTISVPASALRVTQTTPSVADGQPIPVRNPGPDAVLGTADDLVVLAAQVVGQAEFVTEGLKVGTHEVACQIDATADGVSGHPNLPLHGQARGSVLVRDPSFALTFNHPDVIRTGEPYELRVTVVNTSTVRANQVSIALDAASLSGAVCTDVLQGLDPIVALGDIAAGGSAPALFHMQATRTGRVVASSFTSDGDVTGVLRLRTGVANDGTPLSPDSFVFPRFLSKLPASIVDPATALIGIAHGLATIDPTVPGNSMLPPFADGVVRERVEDLVEAARRVNLGQPVPSAVAELALGWLGAAQDVPAFDAVRRSNNHGSDFETGIGSVLATELHDSGRTTLLQSLVDAAVAVDPPFDPSHPFAGPVFALLEEGSDPTARLSLVDPPTNEETTHQPGQDGYRRNLAFSSLYQLDGSELGVQARPGPTGVNVIVRGLKSGTATLTLVYPDGLGGFRFVRFDAVPTAPGSIGGTQLDPSQPNVQYGTLGGEFTPYIDAIPLPASPFAAVSAIQDIDSNPVGKAVTLLFNRRVAPGAQDMRLYALPAPGPDGVTRERPLNSVQILPGERRVAVVGESVICPFAGRTGSVTGSNVPSADGATWSGSFPIEARLVVEGGSVEGRVLGPDGTPVANTQVQLSERSTDDITGEVFAGATSVVKTDTQGAFLFDFVRKQSGYPFRLDSYDPVTGSKGYAAGSIHTSGETLHLDVALQGRGTVRGSVVNASGQPLAGVIIRCAATTDPSFRTAQYSQADGTFLFTSVPIGPVQLQAEDPTTNRIAFASAMLGAPGATATAQIVLTYLPRTSLSFRVIHGADGSAYPDLYVAGYSGVIGQQELYFGVRKTDQDGAAAFASAPAGDIRLEVFNGVSPNPILIQGLTLTADSPATATLVIHEVTPHYGSVAGTVRQIVGGTTTPVAGAIVFDSSSGARTTTATDGTYRLDNIPVGTAGLRALLAASGRTVSGATAVQEGLTSTLDFLFSDSTLGTVAGTVLDQNGAPRANASVELWNWGPPAALVTSTTTAYDGSFVLSNVPQGNSTIQAISTETRAGASFRNAGLAGITIPGPGGRAVTSIQLRGWISVTGRVIARVRDRNGILHDNPVYSPVVVSAPHFVGALPQDPTPDSSNPEYGAIFSDSPTGGVPAAKLQTDPETGTFTVENLHGGHIVVTATNPFYGNKQYDFGFVLGDATKGPIDIVFDGNLGVIDGTLYDVDGSPIPDALVSIPSIGSFVDLQAVTHADGTFVFPLVPFGGTAHIVFQGTVNGVVRYADAYASVRQNAPAAHITLRTLPVGTVDVAVVQPNGTGVVPVGGASVRVDELNGPRRMFTATADSNGHATILGVTGGPVAVQARSGQLSGRTALTGIGEGFTLSATVNLAGFGTVTGIVRSPVDGSGMVGVNVTLLQSPGSNWEVALQASTTDANGAFSMEDVPAPTGVVYGLLAEDPRTLRRGYSGSFGLTVGQAAVHDVTLRAVGSVAGTVTTFDGAQALQDAIVTVVPQLDFDSSMGHSLVVSTGPDGTYRADGVLAGYVNVSASDPVRHLSARGSGQLTSEGQVLEIDLRATPTGTITGSVLQSDGSDLPADAVPPQVRLDAPNSSQIKIGKSYTFEDVAATGPLSLRADEPVSPFHAAWTSDQAIPGTTHQVNLRYGPFGNVRVHGVKPNPDIPGAYLPIVGSASVACGGPYKGRFPSSSPLNLDSSGSAMFVNVGGGFGVSAKIVEPSTGLWASGTVPDFAENQTVDVTVVLRPRGVVRGRFLQPSPNQTLPAPLVLVSLYRTWTGQPDAALPLSAVTGADGRFEIQEVEPAGNLLALGTATDGTPGSGMALVSLSDSNLAVDIGDIILDGVRPTVVSTNPSGGATGLGLTPSFQFTFSEPVYFDRSQVRLVGPFGDLSGVSSTLDPSGTLLTVTSGLLAGATSYEVRLSGTIHDHSWLSMGSDYVLRFTTADLTAPTVLTSQPVPEEIQVALALSPTVVMTKAIDPASLAAGVHLNRLDAPAGSAAIAPALQTDGKTISVNPSASLIAEAEYEVVLDAVRDTAGNSIPSPVHIHFFTVDNRTPTLTLDAPDTAQPVEGTQHTYTVRWADDDVKSVTVFIEAPTGYLRFDGDTTSPARSDRSRSVSLRLPTISAAGGPGVYVHASATDFSGNASMPLDVPLTLQADAKPVVTSAVVQGSSTVRTGTTFVVRVEATDDVGVSSIDHDLPSGVTLVSSSSDPGSTPTDRIELRTYLATTSTALGSATLTYTAHDTAGQVSTPPTPVTVTITADAAPTVTISAPAVGTRYLSGASIPVTFTATDDLGLTKVVLTLGASSTTVSSPANGSAVASSIPAPTVASSQSLSLTAVATDTTGHDSAPFSVALTIAPNLPPTLSILSPAANATVLSGSLLAVILSSNDDAAVASVDAGFPDQTPVSQTNPPGTTTLSVRVPSVSSQQAMTLTAHASDGFNPAVTQTVSVNVVPDAPPTLSVTAPTDGGHAFSGATLVVTGSLADDNNDATATVTFGALAPRTAHTGSFSFSFSVPVVSTSTPTTLSITAVDASAHQATPVQLTINVEPDLVAPTVSIGSPASGASAVAGLPVTLVASASDNVAVTSIQYRVNAGTWTSVSASVLNVSIPTTTSQSSLTIDVQATDGAGNTSQIASRSVTLVANQPPVVTVTNPTAGQTLTSGVLFTISGTSTDDSGTPSITANFNGTPIGSPMSATPSFQLSWTPTATSQPVNGTLTITAVDPQGRSTAVPIAVTIVPDVGGTPTVALTSPAPGVLVAGDTTSLSITYADNVGLATGEAEVTGGFITPGGHQTYTLSGTSHSEPVAVISAEAAFGVPASVTAKTTDLSARTANLNPNPTVLPVAYHRMTSALAASYPRGSLLTASFHISPTGRTRATMLRLEIGTVSGSVFSAATCVRKLAPLADDETLTVPVPVGTAAYYVRSVLVDGTGALAVAARADYSGIFQVPIATPAVTAAPAVTITPQATNPTTGSSFPITATGTDTVRITSVSVTYDSGANAVTKSCANATWIAATSSWSAACTVPFFAQALAGTYAVSAKVTDAMGQSATATSSVTVSLPPGRPSDSPHGDGKPPRVRFLTPYLSPEAVPDNAEFVPTVEASDADDIARIEYFLDDAKEPCATQDPSTDPAAPRTGCFVPRGPEGTLHTLRARVRDGSGDVAESAASLVVRDGVRITASTTIESGDRAYEGQRLYVESEVQVAGPLQVTELYVRHGAHLSAALDGPEPGTLAVDAAGDLVSDVGSQLTATGSSPAGFLPPDESPSTQAAGAPHGGDAGPRASRRAYDSFARPTLPGANGTPAGTRGGGVIALRAARIVLGGVLSADGDPAAAGQESRGGLGAGGSILLEAEEGISGLPDASGLARFGHVSATGGATDLAPELGAALLGAGGRIALRAPEVVLPTIDVSGSTRGDGPASGGAGTLYVRDSAHPHGALWVSGYGTSGPTHLPAVGCGLLEPLSSSEVRAPQRRSPLSLVGLSLEVSASTGPLRFEITGWRAGALHLGWSPDFQRNAGFTGLTGLPYCGVLVLDELHVAKGARLVVEDLVEIPTEKTTVDAQSSLETP